MWCDYLDNFHALNMLVWYKNKIAFFQIYELLCFPNDFTGQNTFSEQFYLLMLIFFHRTFYSKSIVSEENGYFYLKYYIIKLKCIHFHMRINLVLSILELFFVLYFKMNSHTCNESASVLRIHFDYWNYFKDVIDKSWHSF